MLGPSDRMMSAARATEHLDRADAQLRPHDARSAPSPRSMSTEWIGAELHVTA